MEGKALKRYPAPLIKAAVQLNLLEVGKEYTSSITLRAGKKRVRSFEVLACYPDFYSIKDLTNGRTETLRKSDIHCGIIKIEGLNIKEKVLEAVEELKEAEKVKVTAAMIEEAVLKAYNWIIEHPDQGWYAAEQCKEFDSYQKTKIIQGVWEKIVYEGHENRVRQVRGKGGARGFSFIGRLMPEKVEDPEPIMATLESTKELLRIDGLKSVSAEMLDSIGGTINLLKSVGKNVVIDIVFREVANE